jgi:hypothetical protein
LVVDLSHHWSRDEQAASLRAEKLEDFDAVWLAAPLVALADEHALIASRMIFACHGPSVEQAPQATAIPAQSGKRSSYASMWG